jgi:hypothetical protein
VTIHVQREILRVEGLPSTVQLEIMIPPTTDFDALAATAPTEQTIFFLRSKGKDLGRRDKPAWAISEDMPYFRLVSTQGILRNLDGLTHPNPGSEEKFLTDLIHRPFDETMSTVVAAAASTSGST